MNRLEAMNMSFTFLRKSGIRGHYYEFGCYQGLSLINASVVSSQMQFMPDQFYVFDSFKGLPALKGKDQLQDYDVFKEQQYSCSMEEVKQNLAKANAPLERYNFIEGFYDQSLSDPALLSKMGDSRASFVHIDCDLYSSAVPVLKFIENRIVDGSIVMFDDWFCYRGRPDRGVARAFNEWKESASYTFTEYFKYSWSGIAFICNTLDDTSGVVP